MKANCIEGTGAKPGETVICVEVTEDALRGVRYVPGKKYTVVDWFGRPCVHGQSHGKKCGIGDQLWLLPFAGFGATWKLAS